MQPFVHTDCKAASAIVARIRMASMDKNGIDQWQQDCDTIMIGAHRWWCVTCASTRTPAVSLVPHPPPPLLRLQLPPDLLFAPLPPTGRGLPRQHRLRPGGGPRGRRPLRSLGRRRPALPSWPISPRASPRRERAVHPAAAAAAGIGPAPPAPRRRRGDGGRNRWLALQLAERVAPVQCTRS